MYTKENNKEVYKFRHVIPHIGVKEITLYSPADKIYKWLSGMNEINRLNKLRHLGSLSNSALPGVRHARWDYTCAMLYYSTEINQLDGMKTNFSIEGIEFSSPVAALQCLSLLWNIGHLPGTFSVEKGLYRYLCDVDAKRPAKYLPWAEDIQESHDLVKFSNWLLLKQDYSSVSRVLAVIKMLSFSAGKKNYYGEFVEKIAIPFFLENLDYKTFQSLQWQKIIEGFKIVRHLSYLTLDSAYTGLTWTPNIPMLVRQTIQERGRSLSGFVAGISEILSPVEKISFDLLYHSPDARREASFIAEKVHRYLALQADPKGEILRWMKSGLFNDIGLTRKGFGSKKIESVCELKLRSHFVKISERPVLLEKDFIKLGFSHTSILTYKSWNSIISLEPDEFILDIFNDTSYSTNNLGKLILWVMSKVDNLNADIKDKFAIYSKNDIEGLYLAVLKRVFKLKDNDFEFNTFSWRLQEFGLFNNTGLLSNKGTVWAADPYLDSPISKHLLLERRKKISKDLRTHYEELVGLRKLATYIKSNISPRQRYLIFSSSVRIYKDNKPIIEFDGGVMRISTYDGKLTWYGLETKTGKENPQTTLQKKVSTLGMDGSVHLLDKKTAVLEYNF